MERNKTEEELKSDIFKAYSEFHNEFSPDQKPVYFQKFWDATRRWYTSYLFKKEECPFSLEIGDMLERFHRIAKKEESEFFPYLVTSLINARNKYYRNGGFMEKPKDKPKSFKNIKKVLEMEESDLGRKLTHIEEIDAISSWFEISKDKARKSIDEMRAIDGGDWSLDTKINDDAGDMYDLTPSKLLDPLEELTEKSSRQIYCDTVKSIIESKQKRSRGCVRALFTLHCYNNNYLFDEIIPVLDNEILELCEKNGKKLTEKEIYMKYYPNTKDDSAEACASRIKKINHELFK